MPQKSKRKKAKTNRTLACVSATLSMARHNLVNMVAVTAVSGAVLLALLAASLDGFETCRIGAPRSHAYRALSGRRDFYEVRRETVPMPTP